MNRHDCGLAKNILVREEGNRFLPDFLRFQERIAFHGALNSLSQVLVKITAPGVPDLYQGMEVWNLSLVDPDNRRPVDYPRRIALLEDLRKRATENLDRLLGKLISVWKDGRIKLYLTDKALDFRRAHSHVFLHGDYVPVEATGPRQSNLIAFCRSHEGTWVLSVAPRWTSKIAATGSAPLGERVWSETMLCLPVGAPRTWRDVLTGERVEVQDREDGRILLPVSDLLRRLPVALLASNSTSS